MRTGEDKHRLITAYVSVGLLVLLIASAVLVLSGGDRTSSSQAAPGFEPDYDNLSARRDAAGVSTMGDSADAEAHLHPRLKLYAGGEEISIPVNIGIDPTAPPEEMASLHTHETDGTIHVEGMSNATLGQFFEIWGVPFSATELGPHHASGEDRLRIWADGKPSQSFDQLQLEDGQEIVVAFGRAEDLPTDVAQ